MMSLPDRKVVAYRDSELEYPAAVPFDPQEAYPEYLFGPEAVSSKNLVYGAVREVLHYAGLDQHHFGTSEWNPLGDLVPAGGTVLIKPNWVRHYHPLGYDLFGMI